MPRRRVSRSLPPLGKICPGFKGFARHENQSERVLELLTTIIQRNRRTTPQPFYAMREVAAFFKMALTTTARIYRRLEREGMLTLARSSQSMMTPRLLRPRFVVRGVVCMPIWLPGFMNFLDWRRWFSLLEEELMRHRFVLEPIFYKTTEETKPEFVDRVLKFNPDYLLWNNPAPSDRTPMQSIADTGVPLLVVQNFPGTFQGRVYRQSYERGLRQGLKEWKADKEITRIVVPRQGLGGVSATQCLRSVLQDCGLPYQDKLYGSEKDSLPDYLRRLAPDRRTGIIFDDDMFYTRLCLLSPEVMLSFFRRHRVMVMRQTTIPSVELWHDVKVDGLLFFGKKLARQIATDLSKGESMLPFQGSAFEAEWRPRTPLSELAQGYVTE